jgi:uncharacterized protein YozE (UPF0346 family)
MNPNCRSVGLLQDKESVQQNWLIQTDPDDKTNVKLACMSDGILTQGLFARTARKKQTSGLDMDILEYIINYDEPNKVSAASGASNNFGDYCWPNTAHDMENVKRSIQSGKFSDYMSPYDDAWDGVCRSNPGKPCFGLCSTHAYNIGEKSNDNINGERKKEMDDVIALKAAIIAQVMKKNYDILNSTVKQIKTQLQKSIMTAAAEAAGAKSSGSSSSSNEMVAGQTDCRNKDTPAATISCVQNNLNGLQSMSSNTDYKKAYRPIRLALTGIGVVLTDIDKDNAGKKCEDGGDSKFREECVAKLRGAIATFQSTQRSAGQPMVMMGFSPPN